MTNFVANRQKMVDGQVRPSDVTDLRIIDAMTSIPRELFVAERQKPMAYLDIEAEMGAAGSPRRMPKPVIVARLLQAASITAEDDVMVVGCGTGYTAAIAARLASRVVAVESDPDLARRAAAIVVSLGMTSVAIAAGVLTGGDPSGVVHNVIVVDGAIQTGLDALARQLSDGGRLVCVLDSNSGTVPQAVLVTRAGDEFGQRTLFGATAPLLPGFERQEAFTF